MGLSYIALRNNLKKLFYKKPIIWQLLEMFQGFMYVVDYFYYHKLWGHQGRFSIKEFNIEFASQCNLRCKFCSLDHFKPKTIITEEILDKFFNNFLVDKRFGSIEIINLHNGGEILLHPKRIEMLAIIKKYKTLAREKGMKFPQIWLLTNGMLLREKVAKEILELEVIDTVGFSMDGGTAMAFEDIRTNAKWPIFYDNLKTFCRLKKEGNYNVETYSICCIPDDLPLDTSWMEGEFKDALHTLDRYELRRMHNWRGELSEDAKKQIKVTKNVLKIGCSLLMRQMVLLPDGNVTACCNDLNSKGLIGNILKDDIISIYKGAERRRYLHALLVGKKEQIELCKDCQTF